MITNLTGSNEQCKALYKDAVCALAVQDVSGAEISMLNGNLVISDRQGDHASRGEGDERDL